LADVQIGCGCAGVQITDVQMGCECAGVQITDVQMDLYKVKAFQVYHLKGFLSEP
jgi:hypothetical protein